MVDHEAQADNQPKAAQRRGDACRPDGLVSAMTKEESHDGSGGDRLQQDASEHAEPVEACAKTPGWSPLGAQLVCRTGVTSSLVSNGGMVEAWTVPGRGPWWSPELHPPSRHEQTVERPRLIQSLTARPGVRLNLVAAPAGFGKTTLLALWAEVQAEASPVGWVSLDERDNDPVTLWSHILAAIQLVCPELSAVPPPDIVGVPGISAVLLPRFVNELARQGDISLVLDDFHVLSTGVARESLAWLIEHAPPTLHIVVASRTEPGLPLARLRAHGELDELRAGDLDFTSDEADVLLNDRLGLSLDRHDVDELVARTEGWPAGLYLAALSLRGSTDSHDFIAQVWRRASPRRRLPHPRGARGSRRPASGTNAALLRPGSDVRAALRCRTRPAGLRRSAAHPVANESVPDPVGRTWRVVPVPPPVRPVAAGRARASPPRLSPFPCTDVRWSGIASGPWSTRPWTTHCKRAPSPRQVM